MNGADDERSQHGEPPHDDEGQGDMDSDTSGGGGNPDQCKEAPPGGHHPAGPEVEPPSGEMDGSGAEGGHFGDVHMADAAAAAHGQVTSANDERMSVSSDKSKRSKGKKRKRDKDKQPVLKRKKLDLIPLKQPDDRDNKNPYLTFNWHAEKCMELAKVDYLLNARKREAMKELNPEQYEKDSQHLYAYC
ncbi:unnamed protein product [Vitrella brassicaformis CCMP3155]|uniref:Uncharacterized protein n=1 Tax=Vitrella brassicaformis (strain CCMP3155) TaxID=1169540 RepID=A0A0G4GP95_VITBC|nr:unnamed protein product [Vitrella brassicaformis CCMP3155]|eukprot:CEM31996.1 unnamed protein product [Vitrella brassicaformis CCMP3155]